MLWNATFPQTGRQSTFWFDLVRKIFFNVTLSIAEYYLIWLAWERKWKWPAIASSLHLFLSLASKNLSRCDKHRTYSNRAQCLFALCNAYTKQNFVAQIQHCNNAPVRICTSSRIYTQTCDRVTIDCHSGNKCACIVLLIPICLSSLECDVIGVVHFSKSWIYTQARCICHCLTAYFGEMEEWRNIFRWSEINDSISMTALIIIFRVASLVFWACVAQIQTPCGVVYLF